METEKTVETGVAKVETHSVPVRELIKKMETEPQQKMIYSGIPEKSLGFVFGPSKSGKTTFCENLGMCIAAEQGKYLDKPIQAENKKVLFISLEEFCRGRIARNKKQIGRLTEQIGNDKWIDNYMVVGCDIPRYVTGDKEWNIIKEEIKTHKPGIVFIDSMSRLHGGESIEDSTVGHVVMKKLREMVNELETTIVVIHHTPKRIENTQLTLFHMAGSRVLAQEADFIIGINKTPEKKVYVSDVAFRYAPDDSETVTVVKMDEHLWLNVIGHEREANLLSESDGRRDDQNKIALLKFIEDFSIGKDEAVRYSDISTAFVEPKIMSKETVYKHLGTLQNEEKIIKVEKGQYKLLS